MAQTMINIRIDDDTKKQFETVCNELGLSMTTAFTIFAKKTVRENRIPFDVSVDPFFSETNQAYLSNAIASLKRGEGKEHDLIEVD